MRPFIYFIYGFAILISLHIIKNTRKLIIKDSTSHVLF